VSQSEKNVWMLRAMIRAEPEQVILALSNPYPET
jgi:hypothetical protein